MLKDQDEGALQGPVGYEACYGCGGRIKDRFFLLAVDEQWHSDCLKCCECKAPLGPDGSCFVKENNIYCKKDYYRSENERSHPTHMHDIYIISINSIFKPLHITLEERVFRRRIVEQVYLMSEKNLNRTPQLVIKSN
jgi:hypothetical protein